MIFAFLITFTGAPFFVLLVYARSTTPSGGAGIFTVRSAAAPAGISFSRRRYVPGTGRAESLIELEKVPDRTENRLTAMRRPVETLRRLVESSIERVSEPRKDTLPFT